MGAGLRQRLGVQFPRLGSPSPSAGYLGKSAAFDRALSVFAEAYADQNERDYDALTHAVESGRIKAQTGL
jgi:hypothetical protein